MISPEQKATVTTLVLLVFHLISFACILATLKKEKEMEETMESDAVLALLLIFIVTGGVLIGTYFKYSLIMPHIYVMLGIATLIPSIELYNAFKKQISQESKRKRIHCILYCLFLTYLYSI